MVVCDTAYPLYQYPSEVVIDPVDTFPAAAAAVEFFIDNPFVPVVEEPFTTKGDGRTPIVEADGIKYTYLICADYTSNHYAYYGMEADIFINQSYDRKAFQYFTSYGVQARAIESGIFCYCNIQRIYHQEKIISGLLILDKIGV